MTLRIRVKTNFPEYAEAMARIPKQMRYATATTITNMMGRIEEAQQREMRDVFDRPTPYTLNGIYKTSATPSSLTATVGLKNFAAKATPAIKFLAPQIKGGTRRQKRFERALQAAGILPSGYRAVPGSAAKLDQFGNMDRGQIVQLLSYFKAFPEAGYRANMTDKRKARMAKGSKTTQGVSYFVGRPGDRLPLGVWQRIGFAKGSAIKPVLIFVPSAIYQAVFDFDYVGRHIIDREFDAELARQFAEAMRTAR